MTLSPHANFSYTHTYVLKLHHDAAPQHGRFLGRLEHLASGRQCEFATVEELLPCLVSAGSLQESQS